MALSAAEKAMKTDKWTEILFRALSSRVAKRWRFVSFRGSKKREWKGIIDVLAVRKRTEVAGAELKKKYPVLSRGDLLDVMLIQMKGGSARPPTATDCQRLRAVKEIYQATDVVLFTWRGLGRSAKGAKTTFKVLNEAADAWDLRDARSLFG